MSINKVANITLKFDTIDYENSTQKAYKCYLNGKLQWIPKSIAFPIKGQKNSLNVMPFKYQELTGKVPQTLDSFIIREVKSNKQYHQIADYDYIEPKGITLKPKQKEKLKKVWNLNVFALYAEMRTGKTFMSATVVESRFKAGLIDRLIVVSPLRTKEVWRSMFNHLSLPCVFIATEHFSNIYTRENLDSKAKESDFVIIDESHMIKNTDAERTKRIVFFGKDAVHKCILSGTPIGLHAGDLFWQWHFLDPYILNFNSFEDMAKQHLLYGGVEGKKVVGYTNVENISTKISPFTVQLTRRELGAERKETHTKITYRITNRDAYKKLGLLYNDYLDSFSKFGLMKMNTRLQQASSGVVFDDDMKPVGISDNGRIGVLQSVLEQRKGLSGVVYIKYNYEAETLKNSLNVPIIYGGISNAEFNDVVERFNSGEVKTIIVQQRMAQGFSLKRADFICYFSTIYDYIARSQSKDRAMEGAKDIEIIDIVALDTIDERIQEVIEFKTDVYSAIKSEVKRIKETANV